MATDKRSFVLYHDCREPLELLTDEERGKLFLAILDYSEKRIIPEFSGSLGMAFAFLRASLDRDAEAWEIKRKKRQAAGSLGGQQRQANLANAKNAKQDGARIANQAVSVPVNVPVPVPVNGSVNVPVNAAASPGASRSFYHSDFGGGEDGKDHDGLSSGTDPGAAAFGHVAGVTLD